MELTQHFDEFYVNPKAMREAALRAKFYPVKGGFRGLECRLEDVDMIAVMDRIASILGFPIEYFLERQGIFRSLTAAQEQQKTKQIHVDRIGFSGILFLSDSHSGGTTSLYRHRDTGLVGVGDSRAVRIAARRRNQSVRELLRDLDHDGAHLGEWDLVDSVEYRVNRLIVFDTDRFHLAGPGVGSSLEDSKLTQNFNFYRYQPGKFWRRLRLNCRSTRLNLRRPY